MVLQTALLVIGGYLLGAIPFSFLVARARGIDLRTVGSGNIGAANVWRSAGFVPFVIAALLDISKGLLPVVAAFYWLQLPELAVLLVAIAPILGHSFSVFLNFKGGKAVATGGGVLIGLAPLVFLAGLVTWVLVFLLVRISSVASLSAAAICAVAAAIRLAQAQLALPYALFVWLVALGIVYLHRANIQRLLAGTENRFQKL